MLNRLPPGTVFWQLPAYEKPKKKEKSEEGFKESPEFLAKVERNEWEEGNFQEVVDVIKAQSSHEAKWSWARNWNCKYVNLRIDMRDGGFIITNDKGQRISLEHLKYQWRDKDEQRNND